MRKLSEHPQSAHADRLVDALLVAEIEGEVRGEQPWEVWVYDDRQMDAARELLASFDPERASGATREAQAIRAAQERERADHGRRSVDLGRDSGTLPLGPLTLGLIAISGLVAYQTQLGEPPSQSLVQDLSIEPWLSTSLLSRVRAGEVWRLVTPMWIHFGLLHILFNMLWLWRLGQEIEGRHGTLALLGLVLFAQVPSGLGQYLISGPNFGGMSGVVYGLFGFVWMQARYHRGRGYTLSDQDTVIMTVWFIVCLTGLVGPIANVGHAGGLIAGLLAGVPAYLAHRRAHDGSTLFARGGWADTQLQGRRRFVRRYVTPYAPLWFLALAVAAIMFELL